MKLSMTQPLHRSLRERPGDTVLYCGDRRFTWEDFAERVARLAGGLRALGVRPGDRVGMLALNSHRYVEYFYAVWWCGGVVNPVNIRWIAPEIAYSLDDCDTRVLLVDTTFAPMIPALRQASKSLDTIVSVGEAADPISDDALSYETLLARSEPIDDAGRQGDDLAAVMYTGGTTGAPKGVMLSHANIACCVLGSLIAMPRENGAISVLAAPLFHIGGCSLMLHAVTHADAAVVIPVFDELRVLEAIQRTRATNIFLVPTMIKRLIEHPRFAAYDLSSIDRLVYGAAPIDSSLLTRAMAAFPRAHFYQAYGMTECSPTMTVLPHAVHAAHLTDPGKLRSAGRSLLTVEVRVVDANDRDVPAGTVGEIAARGPQVMLGYWNKPEATAAALRGGWLHTGDTGYLDAVGFLYVVDRLKDMIITGGENVYSAEVENAIAELPQVSMVAVIGIPDDAFGERVHAVVMRRPGADLAIDAVIEHCRTRIAGYKCPRSVEFIDQMPLSAAGKMQKFILRAPYWKGHDRAVN